MIKKLLAFSIIFLFMGASVASSINAVENECCLEEIFSRGNTAYAYIAYPGSSGEPLGPCFFDLDDPGDLTSFIIGNCPGPYCGTWTNYGKWLVCDETGALWEIDLCYKTASKIGGGGIVLYGLTYDPVNDKLYGSTGSDLYEIDIDTGNQTYIGDFGITTIMSDIACDIDGVCYGWDLLFSGDSQLYTIDLETGEATVVGSLGEPLHYISSGSFDFETDTLYIAAYSSCCFLAKVDPETGELIHIGNFEGGAQLISLVIPFTDDFCPPNTTISLDPPEPDGCNGWYVSDVNVTLNATDDTGVNATYYRINEEVWEVYESPFVLSEDGADILIEYYSVDNAGNVEDVKSATLDIDQTPPWIRVEWDVTKVGWRKWMVSFTLNITDNTSGIDRIEIFLNDVLQETITGPGPVYGWSLIIYGGIHITFKFVAWDIACNQANVSVGSSDINSHPHSKSIFTQQSNHLWLLKFFERFPLLQRAIYLIK